MPLSLAEETELVLLMECQDRWDQEHQIFRLFPETGPFRRAAYAKSLQFFAAGATHRLRLLIGGNRTSKTVSALYECTLHATAGYDRYAPWWVGKRFQEPTKIWVCGVTDEKMKETLQEVLLGPPSAWGTGILPREDIVGIERAVGPVRDLVDTIRVKCHLGGESILQFKSYKQGRKAFEGTYQHVVYGDEEMPLDIEGECLLRTMDTTGTGQRSGIILQTFTPLQGLTDTVLAYMPDGQMPEEPQTGERHVTQVAWADVPHLSEAEKQTMRETTHPHLRDAREFGIPHMGAGMIFPLPESAFVIDPFPIPKHWRRAYGMDVGWKVTACPWGAYDPDTDVWYLYSEHYRGEAEPSIHAEAIRGRGAWIPGVIDPAANGRSQDDGTVLLDKYRALGLHLTMADNARTAGIFEIWERLSQGRLKIFSNLANWRRECRTFIRDEKGRIVNESQFHLMASTRYLMLSGLAVAKQEPVASTPLRLVPPTRGSWMS